MQWTLMPWSSLEVVARVLMFGADKYSPDNWQHVDKERYVNAAYRHLVAYSKGERVDEETGLPHIAHCITCLLFVLHGD